jgi:hypothetical protein
VQVDHASSFAIGGKIQLLAGGRDSMARTSDLPALAASIAWDAACLHWPPCPPCLAGRWCWIANSLLYVNVRKGEVLRKQMLSIDSM